MCGIAAFFKPGYKYPSEFLKKVGSDLSHRGPDSEGYIRETGFSMVFRRLSIIDPEDRANQPMTDATGQFSLIFNGEIYNYLKLKKELEKKGEKFKTTSDSEVILKGYICWGEAVLDKLEGMFAFVLVDRKNQIALAARDPYGIKPLYMVRKGETTAFCSEMRSLTRIVEPKIDDKALAELLIFGWAAGTLSNLVDIERFPKGEVIVLDLKSGQFKRKSFCDITQLLDHGKSYSEQETEDKVSQAFEKSVKAHLMSDVGYALQLSGGVDSSMVAAMASLKTEWKIGSYSVDIGDHPLNEKPWRDEVVQKYNLDHHELLLGSEAFADAFESSVWHMEGPVPHLGCVMIRLVCRAVRDHTKVVLTGEGADEMFGGYERYANWKIMRLKEILSNWIPGKLLPDRPPFLGIKKMKGVDGPSYASVYSDFKVLNRLFPSLVPAPGYREKISQHQQSYVKRIFAVDQTSYLESLLIRQDKMSMAESVEARVPFVHLPFAKLLNSIPRSIMSPGNKTKPLLKKIGEKYLSKKLLYRRKNGLLLPYREWLCDENGLGRYLDYLMQPDCRLKAYGKQNEIENIVKKVRKKIIDNETRHIMRLINIELWLRSYNKLTV